MTTSEPLQLELNVNPGAAVAPVSVTVLGPGLVSVITCGADDVFTVTLPKFRLVGVRVGVAADASPANVAQTTTFATLAKAAATTLRIVIREFALEFFIVFPV